MQAEYLLRIRSAMDGPVYKLLKSLSCFLLFNATFTLMLFSVVNTQSVPWYGDVNMLLSTAAIPTIGGDGRIYVCDGKNFQVYNSDGSMAWGALIKSGSCERTVAPVIDTLGQIVDSNGWLLAINDWQPFVVWRYNLNLTGSMTEAGVTAGNNGRVYVAAAEPGIIYAFDAHVGSLLWKAEVGPMSFTTCFPRVDVSGWVFIGSLDGFLYAISPDGTRIGKYLSATAADSVIQTCPYLDCSGTGLYVAQVEVVSKVESVSNGLPVISYMRAIKVLVSLLNPFTGFLTWSVEYPGTSYYADSQISYSLDSSLLLALIAQNDSSQGACTNNELTLKQTCFTAFNFPSAEGFSDKPLRAFYIGLPLLFCLIAATSILAYVLWSRRHTVLRAQLRNQRRKGKGMPTEKGTILRNKECIEEKLTTMEEMLQKDTESTDAQDQLNLTMQSLKFVEELLSLYYDSASNAKGDCSERERLLSCKPLKTQDGDSYPRRSTVSIPPVSERSTGPSNGMINPLFSQTDITSPSSLHLQYQPQSSAAAELTSTKDTAAELNSEDLTDPETSPSFINDEEQYDSILEEAKTIRSSIKTLIQNPSSMSSSSHPPSPEAGSFTGDANSMEDAEMRKWASRSDLRTTISKC